MFNFTKYITDLTQQNKKAQEHGFHPCSCSGMQELQGVINSLTDYTAFVCVNDVSSGETSMTGGGFSDRNSFVVFILKNYNPGDEKDRRIQKNLCRNIMRQMQSKLLYDYEEFAQQDVYFVLDSIMHNDISDFVADGCTGVFFQVHIDEPIDLTYHAEEWNK